MSAAETDKLPSSTVARFIQRFREAAPRSPERRRRDRPAMEREFWWTRSGEYKDDPTASPKIQGDEDLQARPRTALAPEEFRSSDKKGEEPYGECSYQFITKPDPPNETDSSGEYGRVLNQTATWALPISPSSSGTPDPPDSEDPKEIASQPITGAEIVACLAGQHVIGAENRPFVYCTRSAVEADEAQDDSLADLDERASTLLEQCRQLLAAPSATLRQATTTKPGTITFGFPESALGDRVQGLSNLSREELENRAWMLLGTSHRLDRGTSPGTMRGTLHSHNSSLLHAVGSCCDDGHRQGEHLAWDCRLAADDQVDSALDEGKVGANFPLEDGDSCGDWVQELEKGALDYRGGDESSKLLVGNGHALDLPLFVTELNDDVLTEGRRAANTQRQYGATLASGAGHLGVRSLDSAAEDSSARVQSALDRLSVGEGHIGRTCMGSAYVMNMPVSDEQSSLSCESSAQPRAMPSGLTLAGEEPVDDRANKSVTNSLDNTRSATPLETPWRQGGSNIASLEDFAEDPVVAALLQRAFRIEQELKERRSLHP